MKGKGVKMTAVVERALVATLSNEHCSFWNPCVCSTSPLRDHPERRVCAGLFVKGQGTYFILLLVTQ